MKELPITGLYWAAMKACHSVGLPWTDPRTGNIYPPPKPKKRGSKKRKLAKR